MTLFNCTDYMASNTLFLVNDELGRMWKDVIVVYFKVN
jgi:hypothetical protein